ncbi:MAG: hypothetical protein HS108_09760 [Planctomycetes bacterium]|nr:hypothetical protein [Planctomycetota bacterium]MCL4728880.1 hypothetical protein [Planctomycetota bacterium]
MPEFAARCFAAVLVLVHLGLGVWAGLGFAELGMAETPWPRLSNPLFSPAMLTLQWTLIATAAVCFVVGYFARWKRLPVAMAVIYGLMALTCAYQTLFILTAPTRFLFIAIEYLEYAVILAFLFRSDFARRRFSMSA